MDEPQRGEAKKKEDIKAWRKAAKAMSKDQLVEAYVELKPLVQFQARRIDALEAQVRALTSSSHSAAPQMLAGPPASQSSSSSSSANLAPAPAAPPSIGSVSFEWKTVARGHHRASGSPAKPGNYRPSPSNRGKK
jgi:hypothetical protein